MPLTETNQTTSRVNLYGNGLVMSGGETLMGDGLGCTRQTTNSSQNVQWSSGYTAFGQSLAPAGSTNNHYGWGAGSGYRSDNFGPTYAASVMKVGCRYYDPEFGCFLTRDTDLSQSAYGYCDGDPVNFSDPSGHDKKKDPPKPGQTTSGAPPTGPGSTGSGGTIGGSGSAPGGAGGSATPGAGGGGQHAPSSGTIKITYTAPTATSRSIYDVAITSKSGVGVDIAISNNKFKSISVSAPGDF